MQQRKMITSITSDWIQATIPKREREIYTGFDYTNTEDLMTYDYYALPGYKVFIAGCE